MSDPIELSIAPPLQDIVDKSPLNQLFPRAAARGIPPPVPRPAICPHRPFPMTRILITRHGESEHNLNTRFFMGRSPSSRLTEKGREQARRLGRRLAGLGHAPALMSKDQIRAVSEFLFADD